MLPFCASSNRTLSSVILLGLNYTRPCSFKNHAQVLCKNTSIFRRSVATQSYSDDEVAKFSSLASKWWDRDGELHALHSFNEIRVPFVRDNLLLQGHGTAHTAQPLHGVSIIDVGCGAGILSENLARLGASVTGIDASEDAIHAAKLHRDSDPGLTDLQYLDSPLEDIVAIGSLKFDCVVASEVVEHVPDLSYFINLCTTVLKPNGSIFISSINKSWLSSFFAIFMAENVLGIVPKGAHQYERLVSPEEVTHCLEENCCNIRKIHGTSYNPLLRKWSWANHTYVTYMLHAMKSEPQDRCDADALK